MTFSLRFLCLAIPLGALACQSQPHFPGDPSERHDPDQRQILPLVRVRLYASGVGYFERRGDLAAGQKSLPVPMGHLDDALKSLVLLTAGSDPISLSFPSRVSPAVARARGGFAASEQSAISYDRLLASLRGEEVRVALEAPRAGQVGTLEGRVVEVVSVKPSHPSYDHGPVGATIPENHTKVEEMERLQLVLLSKENELIRFDVSEIASVRPLEARIIDRLEVAMSARIATRANPTEWLEVAGGRQAIKDLRLGYLAETPTWRASYRLLLAGGKPAELQAWALIHNDTDELWHGVSLELVDGRPSSFLYPLAAPRYLRRDLITPEEELSSVPQLSTTTPDAMWGDFSDYQGETVEQIGDDIGSGSGSGSGQGFGSGHGRLGGSRKTRAPSVSKRTGASDLLWVGDLVKKAGVVPTAERTVSIYKVTSTLNLGPQHSALLPFLKESVSARNIVWFSDDSAEPERAVGLSNNTANTFPEGPMAVFRDGGFLGEAMLSSLKPGARQFARIGREPDLELSSPSDTTDARVKHVDFWNGSLGVHSLATETKRLLFENHTGSTAEVYLGLPIVTNARVDGCERVDFDSTTATPFAVFTVPPGAGHERTLIIRQGLAEYTSPSILELEAIDQLLNDRELPTEERAILNRARPMLVERLAIVQQAADLDTELEALKEDANRLKDAAKGISDRDSKNVAAPVVARLLQSHDELRRMETKKRGLEKELEARTRALAEALTALNELRPKVLEERKRVEAAGGQK